MSLQKDKNQNAINSTENLIYNSKRSLPNENHCHGTYSNPMIKEHQDSYFYKVHYKTCQSGIADEPSIVVFNPVQNINPGLSSKIKNPRDFHLPIQDIFVHFLKKLQGANEFLEQPIVVDTVNVELRGKQRFLKLLKWIRLKDLIFHTTCV